MSDASNDQVLCQVWSQIQSLSEARQELSTRAGQQAAGSLLHKVTHSLGHAAACRLLR